MRFHTACALFIAVVSTAGPSGCATGRPSWLSGGPNANDPARHAQQIWEAAQRYEADGQDQSAYQLYHQLVHEQPQNEQARERMAAVAQKINASRAVAEDASDRTPQSAEGAMKMLAAIQARHREQLLARRSPTAAPDGPPVRQGPLHVEESFVVKSADVLTVVSPAPVPAGTGPGDSEAVAPLPPLVEESASPETAWWAEPSNEVAEEAKGPDPITAIEAQAPIAVTPSWADSVETSLVNSDDTLPKIVPSQKQGWRPTTLRRHCGELSADLAQAVALLDCSDAAAKIEGLQQLGHAGERAQPAAAAVRSLLKHDDPTVRATAAEVLSTIDPGSEDSIDTLIRLLSDPDESIVRLACYVLGKMGARAREAQVDLEILLTDVSSLTALHAAEALLRIEPDDPSAFDALRDALSSPEREQRWFAAMALSAAQGERRAEAAQSLRAALHDEGAEVRAAAALSLGGMAAEAGSALAELEEIARSDAPDVREAAAAAIACLKR